MTKMLIAALATWAVAASASAQIPDFTPQTPLIGAIFHNDLQQARRLLEHGADPNEGRFAGFAPAFMAVQRGHLHLLRLMIARGADLNARDASGSTLLMWAAANEAGEATLVEELLKLGADAHVTNKVGETALDWALRRGDTPAAAALRHAGASDQAKIRASVQRSLTLLQRSGAQFIRQNGCFSCHHSSLVQVTAGLARSRGLSVDEAAIREQDDLTVKLLTSVMDEALKNRDRIPDPPIALGYALMGLAAGERPADAVTTAMADVIAAWQGEDGAFHPLPAVRPPLETSSFTATALSVRALRLYGVDSDARMARARNWLRSAMPRSTEDRAMQLLGLVWSGAPASDTKTSAAALLALQRPEGGWGQLPGLESDAYATGQALVALSHSGHSPASPQYRRGTTFLLRTQMQDGSWLVRTRSYPVQPPKDTGFPHGKHQWISAAGTSWAAMALALSLPPAGEGRVIHR
jgi:N-acyl-D-amino-acid deacylase